MLSEVMAYVEKVILLQLILTYGIQKLEEPLATVNNFALVYLRL
jgi:hypothetical protein